MRDTDQPWRDFICPKDHLLIRTYYRDGHLLADYTAPGTAVSGPEHDTSTAHRINFTGINVDDELADCTDSLLRAECKCSTVEMPLRAVIELGKRSRKLRVPWTVG